MLWQADRGEPLAALVRTFWSWRLAIAKAQWKQQLQALLQAADSDEMQLAQLSAELEESRQQLENAQFEAAMLQQKMAAAAASVSSAEEEATELRVQLKEARHSAGTETARAQVLAAAMERAEAPLAAAFRKVAAAAEEANRHQQLHVEAGVQLERLEGQAEHLRAQVEEEQRRRAEAEAEAAAQRQRACDAYRAAEAARQQCAEAQITAAQLHARMGQEQQRRVQLEAAVAAGEESTRTAASKAEHARRECEKAQAEAEELRVQLAQRSLRLAAMEASHACEAAQHKCGQQPLLVAQEAQLEALVGRLLASERQRYAAREARAAATQLRLAGGSCSQAVAVDPATTPSKHYATDAASSGAAAASEASARSLLLAQEENGALQQHLQTALGQLAAFEASLDRAVLEAEEAEHVAVACLAAPLVGEGLSDAGLSQDAEGEPGLVSMGGARADAAVAVAARLADLERRLQAVDEERAAEVAAAREATQKLIARCALLAEGGERTLELERQSAQQREQRLQAALEAATLQADEACGAAEAAAARQQAAQEQADMLQASAATNLAAMQAAGAKREQTLLAKQRKLEAAARAAVERLEARVAVLETQAGSGDISGDRKLVLQAQAQECTARQALRQLQQQLEVEHQLSTIIKRNFVGRVALWRRRWLLHRCVLAWRCTLRRPDHGASLAGACPSTALLAVAVATAETAEAAACAASSTRSIRPQPVRVGSRSAGGGGKSAPRMVCLRSPLAIDGTEASQDRLPACVLSAAGSQAPPIEGPLHAGIAAASGSASLPAVSPQAACASAELHVIAMQPASAFAGTVRRSSMSDVLDATQQRSRASSQWTTASTEAAGAAGLAHPDVACMPVPPDTVPAPPAGPTAAAAGSTDALRCTGRVVPGCAATVGSPAGSRGPSARQFKLLKAALLAALDSSCESGPAAAAGAHAANSSSPAGASPISAALPGGRHRTKAAGAGEGDAAHRRDTPSTTAAAAPPGATLPTRASTGAGDRSKGPTCQPRRAASATGRAQPTTAHRSDSIKAKQFAGAAKREPPPGIKKQLMAGSQSPAPWVPSSRHISVLTTFDLPLSSTVKHRKDQSAAPTVLQRSSSSNKEPAAAAAAAAEDVSDQKAAALVGKEETSRQMSQQTHEEQTLTPGQEHAGSSPDALRPGSSGGACPAGAPSSAQAALVCEPSMTGLSSQPGQAGSISIRRISSEAPVVLRAPSCCRQDAGGEASELSIA